MFFLIQAVSGTVTSHVTEIGIAALLGVNIWQLKATLNFRDEARTLRQWAFGEKGDNGANGSIKQLRERTHLHGDAIHSLQGKWDLHELKFEEIDRRHGPSDRRHS
jgi:hypothetical protein